MKEAAIAISTEGLSKRYGSTLALDSLDLVVRSMSPTSQAGRGQG